MQATKTERVHIPLLVNGASTLQEIGCDKLALVVIDTARCMRPFAKQLVALCNLYRIALCMDDAARTFFGIVGFSRRISQVRPIMEVLNPALELHEIQTQYRSRLFTSVQEILEDLLPAGEYAQKTGHRLRVVVTVISDGTNGGTWGKDLERDALTLRQVSWRARELGFGLCSVGCGISGERLGEQLGFEPALGLTMSNTSGLAEVHRKLSQFTHWFFKSS